MDAAAEERPHVPPLDPRVVPVADERLLRHILKHCAAFHGRGLEPGQRRMTVAEAAALEDTIPLAGRVIAHIELSPKFPERSASVCLDCMLVVSEILSTTLASDSVHISHFGVLKVPVDSKKKGKGRAPSKQTPLGEVKRKLEPVPEGHVQRNASLHSEPGRRAVSFDVALPEIPSNVRRKPPPPPAQLHTSSEKHVLPAVRRARSVPVEEMGRPRLEFQRDASPYNAQFVLSPWAVAKSGRSKAAAAPALPPAPVTTAAADREPTVTAESTLTGSVDAE